MSEKKTERRYKRAGRILRRKSTKREESKIKAEKKYGYNYKGAISAGLGPDETGHWPSRNPDTGEILKGRRHPTIYKTRRAERKMGYKIKNVGGTLYSTLKKKNDE